MTDKATYKDEDSRNHHLRGKAERGNQWRDHRNDADEDREIDSLLFLDEPVRPRIPVDEATLTCRQLSAHDTPYQEGQPHDR